MKAIAPPMLGLLLCIGAPGCGGQLVQVSGHVRCDGRPVTGSIQFAPISDDNSPIDRSVTIGLHEDGGYKLSLRKVGKYQVVVTPIEVLNHGAKGKDYPCRLDPQMVDLVHGVNQVDIDLTPKEK